MMQLSEIRKLAGVFFKDMSAGAARLLYAWARLDPGGELAALLQAAGFSAEHFLDALSKLTAAEQEEDYGLVSRCIVDSADGSVAGQDLLRGLCAEPGHRISRALHGAGLDLNRLAAALQQPRAAAGEGAGQAAGTVGQDVLSRYGRDLIALARSDSFAGLAERRREMQLLYEVLLRRQKRNVALTGPAGVGKTALAEQLAVNIAAEAVPGPLRGAELIELSMAQLVAGTTYRGMFEERMVSVMDALAQRPNIIAFIDEMHLIWGAGRADGVITDAANIMKPYLARGSVRIIGATTAEEYHRYIAADRALARRFQQVQVAEPDAALTLRMAGRTAELLSRHHGIDIPQQVIAEAIRLTGRHVPNRCQPDKTIDLLDSAACRAARQGKKRLGAGVLRAVLAEQTGGLFSPAADRERRRLAGLAGTLKKRIIGQDHAVDRVVSTLIFRRQSTAARQRPLGVFLFAGESGVGKTELARALADGFFNGPGALLHIDLAEHAGQGSLNSLIGAPAGYAGHEQEGLLPRWFHAAGSGVLLFDEIEKAHPSVHRLLLGLLDSGRITSAKGETFDATRHVVVVTTNAIAPDQLRRSTPGFGGGPAADDPYGLLADHFPREFLNRFDEIILFHSLTPEVLEGILRLRLDEALAELRENGITLVCDRQRLTGFLLARLQAGHRGARQIRRVLETCLLQPVFMKVAACGMQAPLTAELPPSFYTDGDIRLCRKRQPRKEKNQ